MYKEKIGVWREPREEMCGYPMNTSVTCADTHFLRAKCPLENSFVRTAVAALWLKS